MTFDNWVVIVSAVVTVVCYIGYRHLCENVYLKYKDQRAKPNKKKEVLK